MKILFTGFTILFWLAVSYAQLAFDGIPVSQSIQLPHTDEIVLTDIDQQEIREADKWNNRPYQFGLIIPVSITPENSGTWSVLSNGTRIWRLKISSPGALALNPYFDRFDLPVGGTVYVYDDNGEQMKGAFTSDSNPLKSSFSIGLTLGDHFIIEYNQPAWVREKPDIFISEINYAFRGVPQVNGRGFGSSDFCEVNINCSPEGNDWQTQKKGVVRILVKMNRGTYWCTGSMMNNTHQDTIPYLLTADHCAYHLGHYARPDELNQWIFYFNYESWGCQNPDTEPPFQSLTGCQKIASGGNQGSDGSDFYLLKLNQMVPNWYQPFFNGWVLKDTTSNSGVTIHHPEGDIKKISHYSADLISSGWPGGLPNTHWKVYWVPTEHNWGVTEPGSSGAPLFNQEGLIIGTLSGGLASCDDEEEYDLYGKFAYHWNSNGIADTTQLEPWLDPLGLGLLEFPGLEISTGITSIVAEKNLTVYPNPVSQSLNIRSDLADIGMISIFDIYGKQLFFAKSNEMIDQVINMNGFDPGIYILHVYMNDGKRFTQKIIKK